MVEIRRKMMPQNKYSIKCPHAMTPTRIVVHNTYNDASADAEASYAISNNNQTSSHYYVDDKEIVQTIELDRNAWHAGDGNGKGNRQGVCVEICYSKSGGDRFTAAEQNGAELVAYLLKQYGWGMAQVTKHQDYSGKYCPHRTLDMGWARFCSMVESCLNGDNSNPVPTPTPPTTSTSSVNVAYRARTKVHGWLPEVGNLDDYAGYQEQPITDIAMRVSIGAIEYRVHVLGGGWLPWVTGCDTNNPNGYAGNGKQIDAVQVIYRTPAGMGNLRAKYRVAPCNGDYYPWQYDNETGGGMDGYAGTFGKGIGSFQICIE